LRSYAAADFAARQAAAGTDPVNGFHAGAQSRVDQRSADHERQLAEQRSAHWERQIISDANAHRPPAELITDKLAGGVDNLLRRGIIQGERAVEAFNGLLGGLQQGHGWQASVQAARERYGDAIGDLATYQLQTLPEAGLTSAQEAFYRGQVDNAVIGNSALGALRITTPAQQQAHDRLIEAHGPMLGGAIAEQLTQAAHSLDNSKLTGVIAYNRAQADIGGLEKKTESLMQLSQDEPSPGSLIHASVSAGTPGRVLDLIAAPESRGNYNALYRDADQQQIDLTGMTLNEVSGLQRQLVQERGGSPVGRYQIIDDTLDSLMGRMGLSGDERFSPALQDRMGLQLARDAGLDAWQAGRLSSEGFAHRLSQVWAGLPADASNRSYYEGVAGNQANINWAVVVNALRAARLGA